MGKGVFARVQGLCAQKRLRKRAGPSQGIDLLWQRLGGCRDQLGYRARRLGRDRPLPLRLNEKRFHSRLLPRPPLFKQKRSHSGDLIFRHKSGRMTDARKLRQLSLGSALRHGLRG